MVISLAAFPPKLFPSISIVSPTLKCNEDYISKMERELKSTPLILPVEDHEDFVFPDGYWTI